MVAADAPVPPFVAKVQARIEQRWSPPCDLPSGAVTNVAAVFRLDAAGRLMGEPVFVDRRTGLQIDPKRPGEVSDGAIPAAGRAKNAIVQALPLGKVPPDWVGRPVRVTFNAQSACS